ncbi:MAG: FeoA domain-containing protein [Candidatus Omnitrophica bacterium]|nr:FeoA domain-containing protein [Candidatus Omnitrophota bacterium]
MRRSVISLTRVISGQQVRIVSIDGGRGIKEHLTNVGLNVGSEVTVIKHGAPGPFLLSVKETRLAIGQGMAQKIMVSVEGTEGV